MTQYLMAVHGPEELPGLSGALRERQGFPSVGTRSLTAKSEKRNEQCSSS